MVLTALRRAEADLRHKYSAAAAATGSTAAGVDVAGHPAAGLRHTLSDESRDMVTVALDHARRDDGNFRHQHQCTVEAHSPSPPPQQHPVNGMHMHLRASLLAGRLGRLAIRGTWQVGRVGSASRWAARQMLKLILLMEPEFKTVKIST